MTYRPRNGAAYARGPGGRIACPAVRAAWAAHYAVKRADPEDPASVTTARERIEAAAYVIRTAPTAFLGGPTWQGQSDTVPEAERVLARVRRAWAAKGLDGA